MFILKQLHSIIREGKQPCAYMLLYETQAALDRGTSRPRSANHRAACSIQQSVSLVLGCLGLADMLCVTSLLQDSVIKRWIITNV
jgi:hypothetical protein